MPEFVLAPDQVDPETAARAPRQVSTGLAPTAEVPRRERQTGTRPCYVACETCGTFVLLGRTATGAQLAVEPDAVPMYLVDWGAGMAEPRLHQSRGYPVHHCGDEPRPK